MRNRLHSDSETQGDSFIGSVLRMTEGQADVFSIDDFRFDELLSGVEQTRSDSEVSEKDRDTRSMESGAGGLPVLGSSNTQTSDTAGAKPYKVSN